MRVWVVGAGEYEQWSVDGVAESIEAALEHIKATYDRPYIVRWEAPRQIGDDRWTLKGHFEGVVGYSTRHTTEFDIEGYELWTSEARIQSRLTPETELPHP